MNKIYLSIIALFLAGCSAVDFPQRQPMTEQEQLSFTCTDILNDMNETQGILDLLESGNLQAATGAAVGASTLLALSGGVSFDLIGTPIAHAKALTQTKTRLEQLHALFESKSCRQELLMPKGYETFTDEAETTLSV